MFAPSFVECLAYAPRYAAVPVAFTLFGDTETPVSLYARVRGPDTFLLESVEDGRHWGRYSFLGLAPRLRLHVRDGRARLVTREGQQTVAEGSPLALIRRLLARYRSPLVPVLPPFTGGLVGYFAYDWARYAEPRLPRHAAADLPTDDAVLLLADRVVAVDHLTHRIHVIGQLPLPPGATRAELARAYDALCQELADIAAGLFVRSVADPFPPAAFGQGAPVDVPLADRLESNMSRDAFLAAVRKAKDYIAAGDIFQVVLSQRFAVETATDPFAVYRVARAQSPSPYLFYLELQGCTLVGASPEMLVRVAGDRVETRPIAGTRPRGQTPEEDARLEAELLADEKERAEHVMLVDLARNDVGRVARTGTVDVARFMAVERYSHVMHLVSTVTGRLREGQDALDALLACFPAGTLSGAPKVRAMEIIAELEPCARGPYGGAVGYLAFNGNLDTCIAIRTALFAGHRAYVQAGAGIVADSVPEREYDETVNKAKAMLRALEEAEGWAREAGAQGEPRERERGEPREEELSRAETVSSSRR
ncbi:anthranilate synthase component I [Calditerricola satsumensis]|uniref:anthranilate synthase component I n=1 Tax=Calditerricola satsumensis TaxID=373054 RepID=UPI001667022E